MSDFIHAMGAAVTGVTIVTTAGPIGRTISAMCSVSADPALLLVSIRSDSPLRAAIAGHGSFAVNVLSDRQSALADAFAGPARRFSPGDWYGTPPLLHGAAARFICDVERLDAAGTHTLVLGAVTHAERGCAPPLAYTLRGYVAPLTTERLAA